MTIVHLILSLLCIFEVICVPAIFLHQRLWVVILLFLIAEAVLLIALWRAGKLCRWNTEQAIKVTKETRENQKIGKLQVLCILLFAFQIVLVVGYRHTDDDDAWYLGTAVSAYETGEMFAYSPYTGEAALLSEGGDYVLSPLPVFWAALGKLFHIHPTILAHNIVPVGMLFWAYYIYWMLGKRLFEKDAGQSGTYLFLLFMNVLNLFGYFSVRTSGTFLLFRSWQGKAVFCAILVPLLFYYFLGLLQTGKKEEMLGIYLTMGAGCLVSFTAVSLMPLLLAAMALTYAVARRSIKVPLKMCGALVPNILLMLVYILVL